MQLLADDRACTNQAPVLLVLLPGAHMSPEVMLAQGMVEALVSGWTAAFCPGSARRDAAKQGLRRWWHSARPGPDGRPRHSPRRGAACQPTGLLPLRHHHHPQPVATDRPE